MIWYIIAGISFAAALALLIWTRLQDRRYLRSKTSDAMRPDIREELEQERTEAYERRERFHRALSEAETDEQKGE